jgi:hypothetical protein
MQSSFERPRVIRSEWGGPVSYSLRPCSTACTPSTGSHHWKLLMPNQTRPWENSTMKVSAHSKSGLRPWSSSLVDIARVVEETILTMEATNSKWKIGIKGYYPEKNALVSWTPIINRPSCAVQPTSLLATTAPHAVATSQTTLAGSWVPAIWVLTTWEAISALEVSLNQKMGSASAAGTKSSARSAMATAVTDTPKSARGKWITNCLGIHGEFMTRHHALLLTMAVIGQPKQISLSAV